MTKLDVKKAFFDKNPKAARLVPGFVFKYIKKIVHQDEINECMDTIYKDKTGLEFNEQIIKYYNLNIVIKNEENFPKDGRFIFVANHPLGGLDGNVLTHILGHKYKSIKFIVNDLLMNLKEFNEIFIPVNKHGKQSVEYARRIDDAYASDTQMITFPAGLCSRKIKGKIVDLEWKKNFILKARQHKRDIVPIHVEARNSKFFYNLSRFRTFLGIKVNLEMFYLVDEVFKQKNKTMTLTIGKPIPYTTFDKSARPNEWADRVKKHVYEIGKGTDPEFS